MGISSEDFWHEIIKSYDSRNTDGQRGKDHGTYSQKAAVILLIYLAFGKDYSSGIAKYFDELIAKSNGNKFPKVLTVPGKIASILKKMRDDSFLIDTKNIKSRAAPRIYYELNPEILQLPARTKVIEDLVEIPQETVKEFLGWLSIEKTGATTSPIEEQLRSERHRRTDKIFKNLICQDEIWLEEEVCSKEGICSEDENICYSGEDITYRNFLILIRNMARRWDSSRKSCNKKFNLCKLIDKYITEVEWWEAYDLGEEIDR